MMKNRMILMVVNLMIVVIVHAQDATTNQEIHALIDQYTQARETKDTALLDRILAPDVDQLVSSGTWRNDKKESMKGMLQSSQNNPGTRKITIEKVRMLNASSGIVDTKYEIENTDGSTRKMWSTFIVVYHEDRWKISAIRNMLPAG
jgi:uncharacterized protein (TIGR02246 family)